MEKSRSAEYSVNGFDETKTLYEEDASDKTQTEPEQLFVEAVQKLNSYEHSLETLMKRFDKGGSETQLSGNSAPGGTDPSAGGDPPVSGREMQKYVRIRIPFRTAEVILRILDENLDKNERSVLKQAESYLRGARQNLVNVKELIQVQMEYSDKSQEPVLRQTSEIADDMLSVVHKLDEKLLECQVQNLSELLVKAMKDELRLTKLATERREVEDRSQEISENNRDLEKPVISDGEALVNAESSSSTAFYAILFCCLASFFVLRLVLLYTGREQVVLERACQLLWQAFRE